MPPSLSVFARASTSVGKWDGGDVVVCDSAMTDVGDLKEQIAIKMNLTSRSILSLHPVDVYSVLKAQTPPSFVALPELDGEALLTEVALHTRASVAGDTQKLYLIALLSPTEGAWWGCGVVVRWRRAWSLTLPPVSI